MSTPSLLFVFFITLLFAALFAFLETAFTALRLFKLKELKLSVSKYKTLFESWEKNPQRILITILISSNFAHVIASVLISHAMERHLGPIGLAVGIIFATMMILIFGEIIPKSLAKTQHEMLFASFLWIINSLYYFFYPFVTILLKISNLVFSKLGNSHALQKQDVVSEKEIEFLIDYSYQKGLMETEKTEMLQNVFSLGQTQVKEVMTPKDQMLAVHVRDNFKTVVDSFMKSRFSRLPVYENNEENIIGMIHQKDIFAIMYNQNQSHIPIKKLMKPVIFVPESQKINQLLSEFLTRRLHMAMVINEHGNLIGLITLENILEEIVGDISDEHEKITPESKKNKKWRLDC
jgi:putative hemolysin